MKKDSTVNTFLDGLIMDLNPILTPNTTLTNCLNGTIVTFNGNENVLLNDMGNGRVETAYLPEGYVPVGTTELGGIIYIVSYNPLKDKCLIGCFPSPERNITSDEIKGNNNSVDTSKFRNSKNEITTTEYKVELLPDDTKLNPGDLYSIYATNKGITNNFDYLSFIGNTNHTMDNYEKENCPYNYKNSQIYKNVEIHVISISDDGKITYLDDSIKWFENTFEYETDENKDSLPADYYIKEVEGEGDDAINNDIESYRSLVSTAYNIFNSKTSGKLALLFKLNVIDTFSATWNINDIRDISSPNNNYNQEATIAIEMNYTSKHSTINLSNVESNVEIGKSVLAYYIEDGHVISKIDNPEVFLINYDDIDINKQDGKHIEKISKYMFQYDKNEENKVKYTLTPCMSFGKLTYLNKDFTISLDKIGSGDMNVTGWRYFSTSNDITIDLGLETYPKKGDTVEKVELVFYDPSNTVGNNDAVLLLNELSKSDDYIPKKKDDFGVSEYLDKSIETINNKSGYSGNILHKIYLNDDTYPRNCLFLVDILIVVKTKNGKFEYNHNPRFLYTCGIFNSKYYEVNDFNELSIDEFISPEAIVTTKKNTLDNTKTEIPTEAEISSLCLIPFDENANDKEKEDYYYKTMSVLKTTINGEIEYDSKIVDKNWSELFMYYYDEPKVKYSVNYKDANPKADTEKDNFTNCVEYIDSSESPENPPTTLIVGSSDANKSYKDYFNVSVENNTVKIEGVLYSRMNAKVEKKTVSSNNCLRPVLLNTTELDALSLKIYKSNTYNSGLNNEIIQPEIGFKYKYGMYTGDHGGGDSFYLWGHKWKKTGDNYWDEIKDWSELENHKSLDGEFSKDGSFTTSWKSVNSYRTIFNDWMESDNNLFTIWFFNYHHEKDNMQKWLDSKSLTNADGRNYAIMVRTDNIFVPIAHFNNIFGCSLYVRMIASLLCHLYYLTNTPTETTAPVVTNINYLKDYTVNLNINLAFNISGAEVFTKNGDYDLSKPSNKKYKNIYILKDELNSDFPNPIGKIKPHSFFIKNDELYNYYNSHKSNKVNCIIQTLEGLMISNKNFNGDTVYFDCRVNIGLGLKDYFIKVSDLPDLIRGDSLNMPRIVLNNNKLEKAKTPPIYFRVYDNFLKCLKIKDGKLYVDNYELVDDNGIMKTTEPSRGGTHYNITFKGGTSKLIGYY